MYGEREDSKEGLKLVRQALVQYAEARVSSMSSPLPFSYGYSVSASVDTRGYTRVSINLKLHDALRPDEG